MVRTVLLLACTSVSVFAQKPRIISVVNSGSGDLRLSPGVIARVSGANLAGSARPTVTVGGIKADFIYSVDGDGEYGQQFDVQLPPAVPTGPTMLAVSTEQGVSEPFPITINRYSPVFVYPAFLRSTDGTAVPIVPINDCFVQNPASPGDALTVTAGGLGADSAVMPGVIVGGRSAQVMESSAVAGRPGTTLVTFQVPAGDGVFPVVLTTLDGETSQPLLLPVGNVKGTSVLALKRAAAGSLISSQTCGPNLMPVGASLRGDPKNPPLTLGDVTVTVRDSAGMDRPAPILQADCCSISYVVPAGTSEGLATLKVANQFGSLSGYLQVRGVSPSLPLTIGAHNGQPEISGYLVRVRNGVVNTESAAALLKIGLYGLRIDMGPETDDVYLVLFGTGLRNRSSLQAVKAFVDSLEVPVEYAGSQSEVAGIDQVNLHLPRSLAGHGSATLQIVVDGVPNATNYAGGRIYLEIQ